MKVKPHFYGFLQRDMPFRADGQKLENATQLGPFSPNLWPSAQCDWENHPWAQNYKIPCIWPKTRLRKQNTLRVQLIAHQGSMPWTRKHSLGVWAAEVSGSCSLQCGLFGKTNTGQAALGTGIRRLERKCPRALVKGPKIGSCHHPLPDLWPLLPSAGVIAQLQNTPTLEILLRVPLLPSCLRLRQCPVSSLVSNYWAEEGLAFLILPLSCWTARITDFFKWLVS